MSTIPELIKHGKELMQKAVENTKREFTGIRTGKASPHLLDTVRVPAYGSTVPLNQVAMVSAPEPRLLTVQPFDKALAQAIEKSLRESELGLNPQTQGNLIRVPMPPLSQERRKEMVKLVHKLAEEGRVAVRHARTDTLSKIKKLDGLPADDKTRAEKDVQKLTDDHIKQIDGLVQTKEAEVMEV
jgi:ribosome recycling factor